MDFWIVLTKKITLISDKYSKNVQKQYLPMER